MKTYNEFLDEKWILKVNENLFDKIESVVKGKSDKGKLIKQILDKNGIKETGSVYAILYLGGSEPGKKELSNPIDYLRYQPNICKIDVSGNVIILDEKSKGLKVPDTMQFLSIADKTTIEKNVNNEAYLFKPGSIVRKSTYKFDLSIDSPTLTMSNLKYSIPSQNWQTDGEPEIINMDDEINEISDEEVISFKTPMNIITLQQFVDNINKHPKKVGIIDYFVNNLNFKSDKQSNSETQSNTQSNTQTAQKPVAPAPTTNQTNNQTEQNPAEKPTAKPAAQPTTPAA